MADRNPVIVVREQRGLSRVEFARLLGVAYSILARVELGYESGLPAAVRTGLDRLGDDSLRLDADYRAWRASQAP